MKNKLIKLLPLLLLSSILISCNGLQWGKSFDDITDGIYQTVTYYNEDETVSVTRRYMIGNMQKFPDETDTELCTKFGKAGYIPSEWKLIKNDLTQEQIDLIIDYCGTVTLETESLSGFFRMSPFPVSFKVSSWITGSTTFKIQQWEENIDDDEYSLVSEVVNDGVTESEIVYHVPYKKGFEPVQNEYKVVLAGDGSSVIKIEYRRKRVAMNIIDDSDVATPVFWTHTGKYGASVDYSDLVLPEKDDKVIEGWLAMTQSEYEAYKNGESVDCPKLDELPENYDSESYYYVIVWKDKATSSWTIKYYTENIYDEEYSYISGSDTQLAGYAGTTITEDMVKVSMSNPNPNAFDYDRIEFVDGNVIKESINTVVKVYFNRQQFEVTVDLGSGKWPDDSTLTKFNVKYGSEIGRIFKTPVLDGYIFRSWKNAVNNDLHPTYQIITSQNIWAEYKKIEDTDGSVINPLNTRVVFTINKKTVALNEKLVFTAKIGDDPVGLTDWSVTAEYYSIEDVVLNLTGQIIDGASTLELDLQQAGIQYAGSYLFTVSGTYNGFKYSEAFVVTVE